MPCVVRKPGHETLQPAMKGTSCVRQVRLGSFGSFYVFCNTGCSCVRSSMMFDAFLEAVVADRIGIYWNGCMNVACRVLWGGSRSTKPCFFPCKVAAAGDERYLVCVRRVRLGSFWFLLCVLQQWLFLCA